MKYLLMMLALLIAQPSAARLEHVTKAEVLALELDQMLTHKRDSINAYRDSVNAYWDSVRERERADSVEACTQDSACHAEQIRIAEAEQQAKIDEETQRQAAIAAEAERKAHDAIVGRVLGIISLITLFVPWFLTIYDKKLNGIGYVVFAGFVLGVVGLVYCCSAGDGLGFVIVSVLFVVAGSSAIHLDEKKDAVAAAKAKKEAEERREADRKAAKERMEAEWEAAEERREADRKAAKEAALPDVLKERLKIKDAIYSKLDPTALSSEQLAMVKNLNDAVKELRFAFNLSDDEF